jgi:hypothetical protein
LVKAGTELVVVVGELDELLLSEAGIEKEEEDPGRSAKDLRAPNGTSQKDGQDDALRSN